MISDLTEVKSVKGLTDDETFIVNTLQKTWWRKRPRNILRNRYYDGHNRLKDLGISIPPRLRNIQEYVGWPAKAVDYLADRTVLEGFTFNGVDKNDTLDGILEENDFLSTYPQAVTDALTSSFSMISVTKGASNEPKVIVAAHSARDSSAIWDFRLNRVKYAMVVADFRRDPSGRITGPSLINVFTPVEVMTLGWRRNGRWVLENRQEHSQDQCLVEVIRNNPKLGRPFGRSRVSRAVMAITDSAVREALRSEISAEFFTAPQKYILGADDTVFDDKPKWEAYVGCWMAIATENPEAKLDIGQLPQGSMQPHVDYERQLAAKLSGETSIPISSLGVIHDNPSSAEAIYAAKEDIVIKAQNFNRDNKSALKRIGKLMLAIAENKSVEDLPSELQSIEPRFMNPAIPSIASQTDAIIKQAQTVPEFANTRVFWEQLGYDDAQILRIQSDIRRSQARSSAVKTALEAAGVKRGEPIDGDNPGDPTGLPR